MPKEVTVFSDYNCPFCFIGSRRIEKLAEEFGMEIEWKGVEIHPEIPLKGIEVNATTNTKLKHIVQNVKELAGEDGIEMRPKGIIANSRLALEASEFAKEEGKFHEFHEAVFKAYFEEGKNIGEIEVLLDIGKGVGLPIDKLEECLRKRTMRRRIDENNREAQEKSILGVPTFFFGKLPVFGVQPIEVYRKIIERAIERGLFD